MRLLTLSLAYAGCLYNITPEGVYHTTYGIVLWPLYLLITLIIAILIHDIIRAMVWAIFHIIQKINEKVFM